MRPCLYYKKTKRLSPEMPFFLILQEFHIFTELYVFEEKLESISIVIGVILNLPGKSQSNIGYMWEIVLIVRRVLQD